MNIYNEMSSQEQQHASSVDIPFDNTVQTVPKRSLGQPNIVRVKKPKKRRTEKTSLIPRPIYSFTSTELFFLVRAYHDAVLTQDVVKLRFCYHMVYLLEENHHMLLRSSELYKEATNSMISWLHIRERKKIGAGKKILQKELTFVNAFLVEATSRLRSNENTTGLLSEECLEILKHWFTLDWDTWIDEAGTKEERERVRYILYNREKLLSEKDQRKDALLRGEFATAENVRLQDALAAKECQVLQLDNELQLLNKERDRLAKEKCVIRQGLENLSIEQQNTEDQARITSFFTSSIESLNTREEMRKKDEEILKLETDLLQYMNFVRKVYTNISAFRENLREDSDELQDWRLFDICETFITSYPRLGIGEMESSVVYDPAAYDNIKTLDIEYRNLSDTYFLGEMSDVLQKLLNEAADEIMEYYEKSIDLTEDMQRKGQRSMKRNRDYRYDSDDDYDVEPDDDRRYFTEGHTYNQRDSSMGALVPYHERVPVDDDFEQLNNEYNAVKEKAYVLKARLDSEETRSQLLLKQNQQLLEGKFLFKVVTIIRSFADELFRVYTIRP